MCSGGWNWGPASRETWRSSMRNNGPPSTNQITLFTVVNSKYIYISSTSWKTVMQIIHNNYHKHPILLCMIMIIHTCGGAGSGESPTTTQCNIFWMTTVFDTKAIMRAVLKSTLCTVAAKLVQPSSLRTGSLVETASIHTHKCTMKHVCSNYNYDRSNSARTAVLKWTATKLYIRLPLSTAGNNLLCK